MFRAKAVLIGALAAGALVHPAIAGQAPQMEIVPAVSVTPDVSTLPRYTTDGGKTWTVLKEEKGIVERVPSGTSRAAFMADHRMSPEEEGAIVQPVPPVPVVVDGTLYQPEEMHRFDGKQLGFTVGNDGQLYAFTDFAALEAFIAEDALTGPDALLSYDSMFYEDPNYTGSNQLAVPPGNSIPQLWGMDDIFSSMEINEFAANDATIFEYSDYAGLYFVGRRGIPYPNLANEGWNDRTSSLIVWPR